MCVHAAADGRRRRRQHETMSPPPPPTSIVAPMQLMPSFLPSFLPRTFRVADLGFGGRMHCSGRRGERKEGGKTNLPMGRFFLALLPPSHPPCSLFSFPLVWIAFALDGIAITKDEMEGFLPPYPNNAALEKIGRDCERRGSRCS